MLKKLGKVFFGSGALGLGKDQGVKQQGQLGKAALGLEKPKKKAGSSSSKAATNWKIYAINKSMAPLVCMQLLYAMFFCCPAAFVACSSLVSPSWLGKAKVHAIPLTPKGLEKPRVVEKKLVQNHRHNQSNEEHWMELRKRSGHMSLREWV